MGIKDILKTGKTASEGIRQRLEDVKLPPTWGKVKDAMPASHDQPTATCWTMRIDRWMPTPLNKLLNSHWAVANRMKGDDYSVVAWSALAYGIPPATGKRRVSLHVVLPKKKRAPDPDSLHKVLRDALVSCLALKNDSKDWVVGDDPTFSRGEQLTTFITLEDVA